MSSFTLYRETPCEHGHIQRHGMGLSDESNVICPGGSREEVTIDYEAAALLKCRATGFDCSEDGDEDGKASCEKHRKETRPIINAALVE